LALNGQNIMGLEFLVPGAAIADGQESAMELGHAGGEVSVSFDGSRMEYSQLEYNRGNNAQESTLALGGAVAPAADSIAEFRVSTSNYGADVGQHAGALIEMVTKGSTRDFHASAHEYARNQAFDANPFFTNQETSPPKMLNYIYDLPFFKNSPNSFLRQAIGGWRLSGITAMFAGEPANSDAWGWCGIAGYSNAIGGSATCNTTGPVKVHKSIYNDSTFGPMVRWIDPSVLSQPTEDQLYANGQPGMFGYLGCNPLTGPGRNNFDLALFKIFQFPWFKGEHSSLQFRLETFSSFNHTQWLGVNIGCNGLPNGDGSPAFGRTCGGDQYNAGNGEVAGTWDPRQIQLGRKFEFQFDLTLV
jgi:hypothetical protein